MLLKISNKLYLSLNKKKKMKMRQMLQLKRNSRKNVKRKLTILSEKDWLLKLKFYKRILQLLCTKGNNKLSRCNRSILEKSELRWKIKNERHKLQYLMIKTFSKKRWEEHKENQLIRMPKQEKMKLLSQNMLNSIKKLVKRIFKNPKTKRKR